MHMAYCALHFRSVVILWDGAITSYHGIGQ